MVCEATATRIHQVKDWRGAYELAMDHRHLYTRRPNSHPQHTDTPSSPPQLSHNLNSHRSTAVLPSSYLQRSLRLICFLSCWFIQMMPLFPIRSSPYSAISPQQLHPLPGRLLLRLPPLPSLLFMNSKGSGVHTRIIFFPQSSSAKMIAASPTESPSPHA